MSQVRIIGRLMHSHGLAQGNPWAGATIDIQFYGYSQTATEQRPSDRTQIKTNPDGTWSTSQFKNADGDYESYYTFKFPNSHPIKILLPASTPLEIEFSQLAIASTPPESPDYPSLVALINTMLGGSGLAFPAGGSAGQSLAVVQDSPSRVLGWVDSDQGTIVGNAAVPIGGHRLVYLDTDGVKYASNDNVNSIGRVLGLSLGAAAASSSVSIKTRGEITEPSWNWALGPIFLGQNGLLIQSSPGPPANFSQIVGQAIAPTSIVINIQSPIVLGA